MILSKILLRTEVYGVVWSGRSNKRKSGVVEAVECINGNFEYAEEGKSRTFEA